MPRTSTVNPALQKDLQQPKHPPDKLETLKKLARKRVPKAVKAISLCGNLKAYAPTEDQSKAIMDALWAAVEDVRVRLKSGKVETNFSI